MNQFMKVALALGIGWSLGAAGCSKDKEMPVSPAPVEGGAPAADKDEAPKDEAKAEEAPKDEAKAEEAPKDEAKAEEAPKEEAKAEEAKAPDVARPEENKPAGAPKKLTWEEKLAASTPLAANPGQKPLGDKTLSAELCKTPGEGFLADSASRAIQALEVLGDKLVVADKDGVLHGFVVGTEGGCTLSVDTTFGEGGKLSLGKKVTSLSKSDDGTLFASTGMFETFAVKDGKVLYACKASGHMEVHASGKWAIVPWVNATVEIAELSESGCTPSDWVLKDLSKNDTRQGPFENINTSAVIGDEIYLGAITAEEIEGRKPRLIAVYDKAGKELRRFGSTAKTFGDDSFGWVHGISACGGDKVCAVDGNFRRMSVWDKEGKFVGAVKLMELFGLAGGSAWHNDIALAKDGALFIPAAQTREGEGRVGEGLIFRVTGL